MSELPIVLGGAGWRIAQGQMSVLVVAKHFDVGEQACASGIASFVNFVMHWLVLEYHDEDQQRLAKVAAEVRQLILETEACPTDHGNQRQFEWVATAEYFSCRSL